MPKKNPFFDSKAHNESKTSTIEISSLFLLITPEGEFQKKGEKTNKFFLEKKEKKMGKKAEEKTKNKNKKITKKRVILFLATVIGIVIFLIILSVRTVYTQFFMTETVVSAEPSSSSSSSSSSLPFPFQAGLLEEPDDWEDVEEKPSHLSILDLNPNTLSKSGNLVRNVLNNYELDENHPLFFIVSGKQKPDTINDCFPEGVKKHSMESVLCCAFLYNEDVNLSLHRQCIDNTKILQ